MNYNCLTSLLNLFARRKNRDLRHRMKWNLPTTHILLLLASTDKSGYKIIKHTNSHENHHTTLVQISTAPDHGPCLLMRYKGSMKYVIKDWPLLIPTKFVLMSCITILGSFMPRLFWFLMFHGISAIAGYVMSKPSL